MAETGLFTAGSLFTTDYLTSGIARSAPYQAVDVAALRTRLLGIAKSFPQSHRTNESQTEDDFIWPVLAVLGWTESLRQQNLSAAGRDDIPDGLLFADAAAKSEANAKVEQWRRYGHALAIVESKRWARPLDRAASRDESTAPSTQMLRYLRRVDDLSQGQARWGILTNGARWRLYWAGARSVSEEFLEIDLGRVLALDGDLLDVGASDAERDHWLAVFAAMFGRQAFLKHGLDNRSFHDRARSEAAFYEERVAASLSKLVFEQVFPSLATAVSQGAPEASLDEVRHGTLVLLYRLLFLLYAEDRNLLPVNDGRYDEYALRKVRLDVGLRISRHDVFSSSAARIWSQVAELARIIDKGDSSVGIPPYNGGLFAAGETPLLDGLRIPDAIMAPALDALSFERSAGDRRYINYRDLSVQQLGSIYERLLEFDLVKGATGIITLTLNPFARKNTGSYYTPDELVGLILDETLEPLVAERMAAFDQAIAALDPKEMPESQKADLNRVDPAQAILRLKICDPAMGSGHFLVSLVDTLADQVLVAMAEATVRVGGFEYHSPLAHKIEEIRSTILGNAKAASWTIDPSQLDDRHIVRRMVLKRCVYGVDKNPMAVELAKVALWLHTFTVGAPLSFIDHHLRRGDSLFGAWVSDTMAAVKKRGGSPLLLHDSVSTAMGSAFSMREIEALTDAEIAEARNSAGMFIGVRNMTAPLDRFMATLHALDWLNPKDKADVLAVRAWLDGVFGDAVLIALGKVAIPTRREDGARFKAILAAAKALADEQGFLNWQVAFPGVWEDWEGSERKGGFDAVIGNPPWDRMKLQQVEWFAARRPEIARATRASDRAAMIKALEAAEDPLAQDYARAAANAETAARIARDGGQYPLLSGGDVNLYSLFVERAMTLVRPGGMVGLLTPSGIASDKSAALFFRGLATGGKAQSPV